MTQIETNRMLLQTKTLLLADINRRYAVAEAISISGAGIWEGDQWHSTTYREQQREKMVALCVLGMVASKSINIEIISPPEQNDHVETGHMVKARLPDDLDFLESKVPFIVIHILTSTDAIYFGKEDDPAEMVISDQSPLGKALLGMRSGESRIYIGNNQVRILNEEDSIAISSYFEPSLID